MTYPALQPKPMSLDDFEELLADQPEGERWELIEGRVVRMMVGARWEHNRIVGNITAGLDAHFRASGSPCRTLSETFRLKAEGANSSLLPDVLVYCQRPMEGATYLSDAATIIEVMSKGTQNRDREEKWRVYQTLPGLRHYVLVTRDEMHVETIDRLNGSWSAYRIADGVEASLELPALNVSMRLAEVYADVLV